MNIIEFHVVGGLPWMLVLTSLLLTITGLAIYAFIGGEPIIAKWNEAIKQIGGFALAFGAFSTLVAFFQVFRDLEQIDNIPFNNIMGGLKVALITTLYGFGVSLFTQLLLALLKLKKGSTR